MTRTNNKRKIINDPVHGFIRIPSDLIYDLIEHPILQRLRRIKQLGLTHYVYPGATHSRFQHTMGAVHLMVQTIQNLKSKGTDISDDETEAAIIAILLHDIGHGPFSHALEESLISGISHEDLSLLFMEVLNKEFDGKLTLAIQIFKNNYHKKFLHQLVSSQLDMDRMDYLKRDSFFTGVTEGIIGTDRIIEMLCVVNDELTVEAKGIYSIEKFLIARRLMYWQVYFHKTVISSEYLMVKILQRARYLANKGIDLYSTPALGYFLFNTITEKHLETEPQNIITNFIALDDTDITVSIKQWMNHSDSVLKQLAHSVINRKLPKTVLSTQAFSETEILKLKERACDIYNITHDEAEFIVYNSLIANNAYSDKNDTITISFGDGTVKDIAEVSDVLNISYLYETVKKYFLCYPKVCSV